MNLQLGTLLRDRRVIRVGLLVAAATAVVAAGSLIHTTGDGQHVTVDPGPAVSTSASPPPQLPTGGPATTTAPDTTSPTPTPAATSPAAGQPTDGPGQVGDNDDPAGGFQAAVITSDPRDPRDAAAAVVAAILNSGKPVAVWRADIQAQMTPAEAAAYTTAEPDPQLVGQVTDSIIVTPAGDQMVTVTVPVADNDSKPVGVATITEDGTSHRWLTADVDWKKAN